MSDASLIRTDLSDPAVAVVAIDRAARKNCLTLAMWQALAETFERLAADPEVRAIVLTGQGGVFCAGADISEFSEALADPESGALYAQAVDRANHAILDAPKATYAAISGPAMGGGCGLALCCDFRIVDPTAVFAIPAARLGVVYGLAETRALLRAVGLETAKEVLFTGRRFAAEEALSRGLATQLAPDALVAARAHADALRENAPLTIAGAKATLAALTPEPSAAQLAAIQEWQRKALLSEDYRDAVAAFAEKRPPVFHGR